MNTSQQHAALFQALGHPERLHILEILGRGPVCVCELVMMTGKRQAYISQQLAALRDAGLVIAKRQGWNVFYQLNDIRLAELEKMVSDLFSSERPARPKLPRG